MKALLDKISPRSRLFMGIAFVAVVLDQITKYLAIKHLTTAMASAEGFGARLDAFLWTIHPARSQTVAVIDSFWHFRYVENPGAAWGFLAGSDASWRLPFFVLVSMCAMVFIIFYFRKTLPDQKFLRIALAMVFGGAIGNFIDRVRLTYVIDFIDWHWYEGPTWPTFNIADAFISVGVALMILDMFLYKPATDQIDKKKEAAAKAA